MHEHFRDQGAQAYLGTSVAGFPNLFLLTGPNTFVYGSIVGVIEAQLTYITKAIAMAHRQALSRLGVRASAATEYNAEVQRILRTSVWGSGCVSYFLDRHGRNTTMWPWTQAEMSRRMAHFDARAYDLRLRRKTSSRQSDVISQ